MAVGYEQNHPPEIFGRTAELPMSPKEYYKLIRDFNNLIQTELRTKLKKKSERLGSAVTLIATGSDGRREKGSIASTMEIIALVNADIDLDIFKDTISSILREVSPSRIAKISEVKGPKSKLSFFNDDSHRVQPGRIADSRLIYGSQEEADNTKKKLGQEIIDLPNDVIVKRVKGLETDARKVVETGKNKIAGTDAVHFDLENGIVFFNPKAYRLSFKIGPLRLVQNKLLVQEVVHTRNEKKPDFISRLASGIVPRIKELSEDKMLNIAEETVSELTEHYSFFLRLYHRSEQAFSQSGIIAIQLEKDDVDEIARRLQALLCIMRDFKIQKS